ncbi:hypothetical protein CLOP_g8848 [Closterium sp. NIES-67]|nr:hypothetical protein CLOP_g8848 [Closterium sp. NIES-67]
MVRPGLGGPAAGAGRGGGRMDRRVEEWRGGEREREREMERGRGEGGRDERKEGQAAVGGEEAGKGAAEFAPETPPPPALSREEATERALGILSASMAKAREHTRASSRRDAVSQFATEALGSVMSRRRLGAGPGGAGPGGAGPGGSEGRRGGEEGRRGGQRRGPREGEQRRGGREGAQRGGGMGLGLVMDRGADGQQAVQRARGGGGGGRRDTRGGKGVTREGVVQRFIEDAVLSGEEERQVGEFLDFLEAAEVANSALHQRFMVDFEPEYLTDDFASNPVLELEGQEAPAVPSLEEMMVEAKRELMALTGMQTEEEFQAALQDCLSRADQLESLVALYAGPQQMTALQENKVLQEAAEKLPTGVSPQAVAFTKRALLTLQNNPSWTFGQKQQMISSIVRGFSALP